ncbi:MAG: hypothetical protein IJV50_07345 [Lachnospiraceae bacterium]|nr:hypothetical protein [Lachnospiraceae bacterium]
MIKKYTFFDGGSLMFDDSKTVKELIQYAFEAFDYYEPAGMEIVTLFQCHHSQSNTGWFTIDTERTCSEEIENCDKLCFAYHLPGIFYFAEGGWGHHMIELGNHPDIQNPVAIKIRFDDFKNTVVINGKYCFDDIVRYLKNTNYISNGCSKLLVHLIGIPQGPYPIPFSDSIMRKPLSEFAEKIQDYNKKHFPNHGYIYHEEIEIC